MRKNPSIHARRGDTATQNWITFIIPLEGGEWEKLYCFEHPPTSQDIVNAIVEDGRNPLLYTWTTNSTN